VTIEIASNVTGWTPQQIDDLLKPNAYQLSLVGPRLTIRVQTQYSSQTATSAGGSGGLYTSYSAVIYLKADSNAFVQQPQSVLAHEYGHAWTLYHFYLTQQGSWASWLAFRGLAADPRLDTSYVWNRMEIIAEDYRLLFGTPSAVAGATPLNPYITDARAIPGYRDWLVTAWARV
jgi:hypothetical protein